ncbi:unknown [Prevotella sp. CAG:1124]|nr:unknown [Prevotella sp. CAG:1124]
MYETVMSLPSGTCNLKFPSKSETAPLEVPFWNTEAPITGIPWSSTICPVQTKSCADAASDTSDTSNVRIKYLHCFIDKRFGFV